jgi:hypothetical protein
MAVCIDVADPDVGTLIVKGDFSELAEFARSNGGMYPPMN